MDIMIIIGSSTFLYFRQRDRSVDPRVFHMLGECSLCTIFSPGFTTSYLKKTKKKTYVYSTYILSNSLLISWQLFTVRLSGRCLQWVYLLCALTHSLIQSFHPCHWTGITLAKITASACQIYWHFSKGYPSFSWVAPFLFTLMVFPNFSPNPWSPFLVYSLRLNRISPVGPQGSVS